MKHTLNAILILLTTILVSCRKELQANASAREKIGMVSSVKNLQIRDSVQAIIDKYIAGGIPGIQVTLKTNNQGFTVNGGYAQTENHTKFRQNENEYIFSITKTFTAVLAMKMQERSLIDLDKTIQNYLPADISNNITGSNSITVRMLLNHSSGLVDFTSLPEFLQAQFTDPLHQPTLMQDLQMVYNRPLNFDPGTDFSYSNTNYLLLQMILADVSGQPYKALLEKEILQPLQLNHTFYDLPETALKTTWVPAYYADLDADGIPENVTEWNKALGNASGAYGGIISTANDVIKFFDALVNGKVVSAGSLSQMTNWIQGSSSTQPDYGLGLEYFAFGNNSTMQFGHEGDGVGCTTQIMYVPATKTYLYINCNIGRKVEGPFLFKTTDFKNELCNYIASLTL
jgi:D-alanyl-D-alanine carboxypeptidase